MRKFRVRQSGLQYPARFAWRGHSRKKSNPPLSPTPRLGGVYETQASVPRTRHCSYAAHCTGGFAVGYADGSNSQLLAVPMSCSKPATASMATTGKTGFKRSRNYCGQYRLRFPGLHVASAFARTSSVLRRMNSKSASSRNGLSSSEKRNLAALTWHKRPPIFVPTLSCE